jgi:hypothetical protein
MTKGDEAGRDCGTLFVFTGRVPFLVTSTHLLLVQ